MESEVIFTNISDIRSNLYSFALRLTANRDDAEDLLHDTIIRIIESKDSYTECDNFKGWAFTIMRNTFINNYRRMSKISTFSERLDDNEPVISVVRDTDNNIPDNSLSALQITETINNFSDIYREPLNLYVAGYKYHEIAEKLNIPVGTIKSRIFVARRKLQSMYADVYAEYGHAV